MAEYKYQFPEKNPFRAMEVTEPEFDISIPENEHLYIRTLQGLRSPKQFTKIEKELGIFQGKMTDLPNRRLKIIFSGHRGSGKTVELLRFQQQINQPDKYFSVFLSLQKEIEITKMEPEDLYFILIKRLIQELREREVPFDEDEFEEIAEEWVRDQEITKELKHNFKLETGAELEAGFKFWNLFSAKGFFKSMYGYDNATTTKIRKSIRLNPGRLSNRLNIALQGVSVAVREAGLGQDILFIIDDFEKSRPEVYKTVFLDDPQFFIELRAHFICCVPISTFYQVKEQEATAIFTPSYLPMIRLQSPEARTEFGKIVTVRADAALFGEGVLDAMIDMSGGSPRQFLQLANQVLLDSDDPVVSLESCRYTFRRMRIDRERRLTAQHHELLSTSAFGKISPEMIDLLIAVNVMEYNGDDIERQLNPLLRDTFAPKK
jgi:hypothetical protein